MCKSIIPQTLAMLRKYGASEMYILAELLRHYDEIYPTVMKTEDDHTTFEEEYRCAWSRGGDFETDACLRYK